MKMNVTKLRRNHPLSASELKIENIFTALSSPLNKLLIESTFEE